MLKLRKIYGSAFLAFLLTGWITPLLAQEKGKEKAPAETAKPVVTIVASIDSTDETSDQPASFTVRRAGKPGGELAVSLEVKGTAKSGVDFQALPSVVKIPAGKESAVVPVKARADSQKQSPTRTVVVNLKPAAIYDLGASKSATVKIEESKPLLFVATLRPTKEAPESTAYGTATLLLAPDRSSAKVTVTHANLSSPHVSSHLKLAGNGNEGAYLINFPAGQSVSFDWAMQPTGQYSSDALRTALERGRIYAAIDTKNHPTGELQGNFIRANASEKFQPPPPPPKQANDPLTPRDVARFLTQATFGPTKTDIDEFLKPTPLPNQTPPKPKTFPSWINEQMSIPASSHVEVMRADYRAFPPTSPRPRITNANRQVAWWQISLTAPDQLRQRVAFALSEIFVVSDVNDVLSGNAEATANYYDMLARNVFGNFRDLLEDVTLSPIMGAYLSHLKNAKADPTRGTSADENYAREVMQLFTIGLNQLQPDGTLRVGRDGLPIPTYDQRTITEMAKVFTGWGFYSPEPKPNFGGARANYFEPMMLYAEQHDDSAKTIVGGIKIAEKQGGGADLKQTLDALFNHPNTGPFFCRQLIQRLVTSNPSPAYVYRVSQVFARNSRGERGDLGAVIRAILLDYEARSPDVLANFGYGKLKEPLLLATATLRAFDARTASGRYYLPNPEGAFAQAALRSPTVFNFFEPFYVLPGPLAAAGLYAPEYQIFTDSTAISIPNQLRNFIYTPEKPSENAFVLKLEPLVALAKTPDELVDYLNLVFCSGSLSEKARKVVLEALAKLPPKASDLDRARTALDLVITSPEAAIQR